YSRAEEANSCALNFVKGWRKVKKRKKKNRHYSHNAGSPDKIRTRAHPQGVPCWINLRFAAAPEAPAAGPPSVPSLSSAVRPHLQHGCSKDRIRAFSQSLLWIDQCPFRQYSSKRPSNYMLLQGTGHSYLQRLYLRLPRSAFRNAALLLQNPRYPAHGSGHALHIRR